MKGYQRKVIYLKNTGSRHFEEAYFVLREDSCAGDVSRREMVEEANEIIKENFFFDKKGVFLFKKKYVLAFTLGSVCSLIPAVILYFLL